MKFLDVTHPEGGRFLVHIDHITSVHYRPAEGDIKARLGLDLDARQNEWSFSVTRLSGRGRHFRKS